MKEKIYTVPVNDAFAADSECPVCAMFEQLENDAIEYTMGPSYMEDDIREKTDATGFCRHHFKMMYDYGNRLGNALILSTHLKKLNQELTKEIKDFTPSKSSLFSRMKRTDATGERSASTRMSHPGIHPKRLSAHGSPPRPPTAMSATILTRFTDAIWILFLTYTKITMNFGKCFMKARDFVSRTSAT